MAVAVMGAWKTTFRSLSQRNYRLFWFGTLLSNIGTWVQRVAQDWLVLDLTHSSATALGLVTSLQFGPSLLFTVFGGAIADRADRRKVLFATNLAGGLLSLVLGLLVVNGDVRLWHVYATSLAAGCVWAFDVPSRQTFVNELVGQENLPNAVGLNATSFNLGRLIGPAVSGLLIERFDTGPSFIVNAASFSFVLISLVLINPRELHRRHRPADLDEPMWTRTKAGFAYVRQQRELRGLFVNIAVMGTLGMNFQIWTALMARLEFGKSAGAFGLLGTAMAVGSVTGALMAARRRRTPNLGMVTNLGLAFAAVLAVSSLMPSYGWYALSLPLCGAAALSVMTTSNATMQLTTDPDMRGRVAGIYFMVFTGGSPLGSPLIGAIAQHFGPRSSILVGAVSVGVTAALVRRWRSRIEPAAQVA
ncbi:MAG: MFS transporter [Actinomycetales bacterium]|nr:MFS transporter [Actinomycetales bacterium]